MSGYYLGEIRMVGFNFAPRGWALCSGQIMSIQQNTALFSLLGTTYGGNGQTTFGLPDLRGRVPMNWGNGPGLTPRVQGEMDGVENVTLLNTQMPQHSHLLQASDEATTKSPSNAFPAFTSSPAYSATANQTMSPAAVAASGGSQPHENMQPYLAVTFAIAITGIFPSRN
jgi:microcystin-dependent protein